MFRCQVASFATSAVVTSAEHINTTYSSLMDRRCTKFSTVKNTSPAAAAEHHFAPGSCWKTSMANQVGADLSCLQRPSARDFPNYRPRSSSSSDSSIAKTAKLSSPTTLKDNNNRLLCSSSSGLVFTQRRNFWSGSNTNAAKEEEAKREKEMESSSSSNKQSQEEVAQQDHVKIDIKVEEKKQEDAPPPPDGQSTATPTSTSSSSSSWTDTVTNAASGAASTVATGAASVAGSAASTVASGAANVASSAASSVSSSAGAAASSVASAAQAQAEATIKKGATGDLPSVVGSMMMGLGFSKGYLVYGAAMTLLRSRMARSGAWSIVKFFGRQLMGHPYFTGTCVSGAVIFYWVAAPIAAVVSGAVCVAIVGLFLLPRGVSSWIFSILGNSFLAASSATAAPATGAAGGAAALPLASYLNTIFWFGVIGVATVASLKCKDLYEENLRLKEKIQAMEEHKSYKM